MTTEKRLVEIVKFHSTGETILVATPVTEVPKDNANSLVDYRTADERLAAQP